MKTLKLKIYGHADFVHHNFIDFNKYRVKSNLFYTNEKNSLNRITSNKLNFYIYHCIVKQNL